MQPLPTNEINPETFLYVYKVYTTLTFRLSDFCKEYHEILTSYTYPFCITRGKLEKLERFLCQIPDDEFERCVISMAIPGGGCTTKVFIKEYYYYHEATVFIPEILRQIRTQVPKLDADNTNIRRMNFNYTGSNSYGNSIVL